jgi:hypothetical protein
MEVLQGGVRGLETLGHLVAPAGEVGQLVVALDGDAPVQAACAQDLEPLPEVCQTPRYGPVGADRIDGHHQTSAADEQKEQEEA